MYTPIPDEVQHNVAETLFHLGLGYEMEGQYDEAVESYRRALKRDPHLQPAKHHLEQLQNHQELALTF